MEIIESIDKRIGEVRTDSVDMSIGELVGLHSSRELIIQPDFQRLFRWSDAQRSRLVESVLIQLPIPSIFVIENDDGRLELVDGLQRVSSLIQFINNEAIELPLLTLEGCDLVPELNGTTFEDLPLTLKLKLKRSAIRTVIIKRQSNQFLRYEMFKRLNTGGSKLSDQDIRNVNARILGGADFYAFINKCAQYGAFRTTMELLSPVAIEARGDEELVLRFFAVKNYRDKFKGSISDWLDTFMEDVLLGKQPFDMDAEWLAFTTLFDVLADKFGPYAFVKYRNGLPIGSVAPAYYEAVTCGSIQALANLQGLPTADATARLAATVESIDFRNVTGPGANSLPKMNERINLIGRAFSA
ncbi:DUF262 domain-containing protein [Pseudoduganella guangdongensis]|nr:DUF262 domain-containing protein [Pseudoduganella guangdongensis]